MAKIIETQEVVNAAVETLEVAVIETEEIIMDEINNTIEAEEVAHVETREEKVERLSRELAELGLVVARPAALPTARKAIASVYLNCPAKSCGEPVLNSKGGDRLSFAQAGPGHVIQCTKCSQKFTTPKSAFIY